MVVSSEIEPRETLLDQGDRYWLEVLLGGAVLNLLFPRNIIGSAFLVGGTALGLRRLTRSRTKRT